MSLFHIRVTKDFLVFSAGHFITYAGDICERLHGHNYHVAAEVYGPLDENHYVVDFVALRDILKELVAEWDHHMLLPTEHSLIHVQVNEREVEATFRDRRWVFPREDCVLLPIANTTTELLAELLGRKLLDRLTQVCGKRPAKVRVEIDECTGQSAICELSDE